MRPLIHPALAQVWRDRSTVQIGLDPARALVLGGLDGPDAAILRSLDGGHDEWALRSLASATGGDPAAADRLIELLREAGVAVDGDEVTTIDGNDPCAPDIATLGLLTGAPDGGAEAAGRRSDRWVDVRGAGRVGAQIVRLLGAAGVGRTTAVDDQPVTAADLAPGGHGRRQLGRRRDAAVQRLAGRSAARSGPSREPTEPSLVVVAPPPGTLTVPGAALLGDGIPHLVARVTEATGTVGPLVMPGRSACLRCVDLHRTDRDPAWPKIVAQSALQRGEVDACDVTLATQVAAIAAQQALALLDGFIPATVGGTIEVALPYGLPRRRSWPPHPACGCTWD